MTSPVQSGVASEMRSLADALRGDARRYGWDVEEWLGDVATILDNIAKVAETGTPAAIADAVWPLHEMSKGLAVEKVDPALVARMAALEAWVEEQDDESFPDWDSILKLHDEVVASLKAVAQ